MLRTRFTDMFDLEHPIMSAPMAMHSGGTLAGAVSAAGGLGSFGGIHTAKGPDWIRSEIAGIRAATDGAFGIGFITPFLPFAEANFEAALGESPSAVAFSFSDPGSWLARARDAGARTICQVQNFEDAATAVDLGTDVLVAQGTEAGGHTGTMSVLPLLSGLVRQYPETPILVAGGIGDGRTLAAALTAGADGAWLGTAFMATPEAVEVHETNKTLIVESDGADTVFTRCYDIAAGLPWPAGIGERVRRNRFTDEWEGREVELTSKREELAARVPASGSGDDLDPDSDEVLYGQSAGLVGEIRPAADVVRSISQDAEQILRTRPASLLG